MRRRATTGIADWGRGVVRWREEKACTGTGLVHFGDPEQASTDGQAISSAHLC
jgi:hypothetical protein